MLTYINNRYVLLKYILFYLFNNKKALVQHYFTVKLPKTIIIYNEQNMTEIGL